MQTLEGLRRQIDTASDLNSVVATMKTLAAVSIHQYERAVEALHEYNRTIELGFQIVLRGEPFHLESGEDSGQNAAIVFGSDQGMCGRFNEELGRFADASMREETQKTHQEWVILAVGARLEGQLLDASRPPDRSYPLPTSVSEITNLVEEILPHIERLRGEGKLSRLFVFYNHRTGGSAFQPQRIQLLPLAPHRIARWRDRHWQSRALPSFVTDRRRALSRLVQQYLFVSLFRACAESLASENASRIAAMQAAEKNIEERLGELHGVFNQLRQSAITEELIDIVTGFEALSQEQRKKRR